MNLPAYGRQILCAGRVHSKKIRSLLEMDTTGLPVMSGSVLTRWNIPIHFTGYAAGRSCLT